MSVWRMEISVDLCDTGTALYQLSEQANRRRWSIIRFDIKDDDSDDHDKGLTQAGQGACVTPPPATAKETNDYDVESYDLRATTMALK